MQPMPMVPRVDFGKVIARSFQIYLKNLPAFLLLATIVFTPIILWAILARNPDPVDRLDDWNQLFISRLLILSLGCMVLQFVLAGAVTFAVVEEHGGRHASIAQGLRVGVTRLPLTLAVGLLVTLLTMLGVLAIIVGALVVMCMMYVAVPATVVERPGITAALVRSAVLTKGYRWWIFLLIVMVGFFGAIFGGVLEQAIVHHISIEGDEMIDPGDFNRWSCIQVGVQVLLAPLQATFAATAYIALRSCKEGIPIDQLSKGMS